MGIAIVITSGKGGTGKSSLTVGVGSCLAAMGKRVLCIDMDIGLRNLDFSMGLTDRALMDVSDVLQGRCSLSAAVVAHPKLETLFLLAAPVTRPVPELTVPDMIRLVSQAKQAYDYVLLDCPAGIGSGYTLSTCAADRAIVVSTTDPVSIRAAQAAVNGLRRQQIPAHLVVNRITRSFLRRTHSTVDDAMDALALPLIGIIPEDNKVTLAASRGELLITQTGRGAAKAYYNISKRMIGQQVPPMRI